MTIQWVTGFLDLPVQEFETARDFWLAVTGCTLSPPRGPGGDFATLSPDSGDACLRVQRTYGTSPGCHLDFHTDDLARLTARARRLGARQVHGEDGLAVLRSPGGLPFCLSGEAGGPVIPAAARWPGGSASRLDQFSLDIPASAYDAECAFWADLTGWEPRDGRLPEFRFLAHAAMPLRLLLQRTGDPAGTQVRAHPDLACAGVEAEVTRHLELGARWLRDGNGWVTLLDPADLPYCVTPRDPAVTRPVSCPKAV